MRTGKYFFVLVSSVMLLFLCLFAIHERRSRENIEHAFYRAVIDLQTLQEQASVLITTVSEIKSKLNTCEDRTQKLDLELQNRTKMLEKMTIKANDNGPSMEEEKSRREMERSTIEFLRYMHNKISSSQLPTNKIRNTTKEKEQLVNDITHFQMKFKSDMYELAYNVNGHDEWRKKESERLGNLVQRRLEYLQPIVTNNIHFAVVREQLAKTQTSLFYGDPVVYITNPRICESAKILVYKLRNECGFGCQLHGVTAALIMAYATRRTLILQSDGWQYAHQGWTTTFLPLGKNCTVDQPLIRWRAESTRVENAQFLEMPVLQSMSSPPDYFPLSVPEDLVDKILRFHGDPAVWWIGQFVKYISRPNMDTADFLNGKRQSLKFKNPIIGVHIRRTDKINREAQMHDVAEYMTYVKEWYDMYEKREPGVKRRVYIASDDQRVLKEAREKYPKYIFISDTNASLSAAVATRYSEVSLQGIIQDINMLSLCDYLVCTFSSQVCRAAYELMQTRHGDASQRFKSLDDIYYFGGQNMHRWRVTESHQGPGGGELTLNKGDLIKIYGNLWNGFSKGQNLKSSQVGTFPSYKAIDIVEHVKMPTYPEVPET